MLLCVRCRAGDCTCTRKTIQPPDLPPGGHIKAADYVIAGDSLCDDCVSQRRT